ncbi:MAG: hypothetical protein AAF352_08430, partial [Pseudomonadota bacterium]
MMSNFDTNTLLGYESIIAQCFATIDAGKFPHAILIHGPRGTGKTTLGLILAKYILRAEQQAQAEESLFGDTMPYTASLDGEDPGVMAVTHRQRGRR